MWEIQRTDKCVDLTGRLDVRKQNHKTRIDFGIFVEITK